MGIVASRHCRTSVVTASVEASNFHKIRKGYVITIFGRMNFRSNNTSIETHVLLDTEPVVEKRYRLASAFFTKCP